MKLDSIDLLKLMPRFMREDETTQAMCKAILPYLQKISDNSLEFLYSLLIDTAPEWWLDQLAWEQNITWYDTDASIQAKRNVVRNAEWVKRHLGTKAAVETTVFDYFGDATVEEWFEYNGKPFHFRVITTPEAADDKIYQFRKAVENTKNVRSYLEAIITVIKAEQHQYAAITTSSYEHQKLIIPGLDNEQDQCVAITSSSYEHQEMTIPGLEHEQDQCVAVACSSFEMQTITIPGLEGM